MSNIYVNEPATSGKVISAQFFLDLLDLTVFFFFRIIPKLIVIDAYFHVRNVSAL